MTLRGRCGRERIPNHREPRWIGTTRSRDPEPPGEDGSWQPPRSRPTFSQAVSGYDGGGRWREDFPSSLAEWWVWSRGEAVQS